VLGILSGAGRSAEREAVGAGKRGR
jgi:hypothetical protein